MKKLDLHGLTCPAPVIETKKFLENSDTADIEILLDDDVARENVTRFLTSKGFGVSCEKVGDGPQCVLKCSRTESGERPADQVRKRLVVFIDGETLGRGNDELGRVLMNSFLKTLRELDDVPWRIALMNGGVKLAAEGSAYLDALTAMEGLGVEILACGTCLDYFYLKDKLRVGRISNMHEIVSSLLEATNVIKP
jgi:selenium metabolism protein YedF